MRIGETLLLRQQAYDRYRLPTVATYIGTEDIGKFPFTKTVFQVKAKYLIVGSYQNVIMSYETLALLREDYQTVAEFEAEERIRQRLKRYCTR